MIEPHDRLRAARVHAGYPSAAAAARAFGWGGETYKSHEAGTRGIKVDVAATYARALRVDPEWILYGRNPPRWQGVAPVADLQAIRTSVFPEIDWHVVLEFCQKFPNLRGLPVLSWRELDVAAQISDAVFFLKISDKAMASASGGVSFDVGDMVACNPKAAANPGDFVIALPDSGATPVLRKLQLRSVAGDPVAYDLLPLNPDFPTMKISGSGSGRVIGRVVAHTKHF